MANIVFKEVAPACKFVKKVGKSCQSIKSFLHCNGSAKFDEFRWQFMMICYSRLRLTQRNVKRPCVLFYGCIRKL